MYIMRKITLWKKLTKDTAPTKKVFGRVGGKRSVMADATKTTARQRSHDPFPGPSGV